MRSMLVSDRFPPPWYFEEIGTCFVVKDQGGQALAFVYCDQGLGRRSAANPLTKEEARRIAANITKLPELMRQSPSL